MNESAKAKLTIALTLILCFSIIGVGSLYISYQALRKENVELKTKLEFGNTEKWLNETEKLCIGLLDSIKQDDPKSLKEYAKGWTVSGSFGEYGRFAITYDPTESNNDIPYVTVMYFPNKDYPTDYRDFLSALVWENLFNAPTFR